MARRDIVFARKAQVASGVLDHGTLAGLADDDHSQYHTDARALTWLQSQNVSELVNDAGYLVGGANATVLDGTAYRTLYIDSAGDVQELAHGTSGKVLTSNGASANPSWETVTSLTNFQDNGLAGEGLYNSNVAFTTTTSGLQLDKPGGGGDVILEMNAPLTYDVAINLEVNNTVKAQVKYDNGTELYFRTAATGETFRFFNDVDGDLLHIAQNGIEVFPATLSNGHVYVYDSGATEYGLLRKLNGSHTQVYNSDHGQNVQLLSEDAVGTAQTLFDGDPDGAVDLYYDGTKSVSTTSFGLDVFGTGNQIINGYDGATQKGNIQFNNATYGYTLYSIQDSQIMTFLGENAASTRVTLFEADPDVGVNLYYPANGATALALATQTNGIQVYGTAAAGVSEIEMYDNASTQQAAVVVVNNILTLDSTVNSDWVRLRGRTSAGAVSVGLVFDPDSGIAFNGVSTPVATPTYNATNVTTDRTYNANSTTLAEVADVLGTLIADLRAIGLVN